MEWNFDEETQNDCYAKIVVQKNNQEIPNRIVGFHFVGPNAGEVTQGFAVAIKKGLSKEELDLTVGIHPTSAEVIFRVEEISCQARVDLVLFSKL